MVELQFSNSFSIESSTVTTKLKPFKCKGRNHLKFKSCQNVKICKYFEMYYLQCSILLDKIKKRENSGTGQSVMDNVSSGPNEMKMLEI